MINFHGEGEKEKDREGNLKKLWRVAEEKKKSNQKMLKDANQRRDRIYNLFPHTV